MHLHWMSLEKKKGCELMKNKVPMCQDGTYGYGYLDDCGDVEGYVPCGRDFELVSVSHNIDTNEYYLTFQFEYMGEEHEITMTRNEAFDVNKLKAYASNGLDVNASNIRQAISVIALKENEYMKANYALEMCHSKLGWKDCIVDGVKVRVFFGEKGAKVKPSKYAPRQLDVSCKGTSKEWLEFVRANIVGNIGLEFMLSTAFASPLLAYLKPDIDCENFIVHLVGDSSTGKTTSVQLAISVFGNPVTDNLEIGNWEIGENKLISTWSATMNSLIARLMGVNGMLLGIEEMSMVDMQDMSSVVYKIASGVDKDRLTRDGEMKKRRSGTYIVVSTGEASLLGKCNHNIGLRVRVLEFSKRQWTQSANQSEMIKNFVLQHYGCVGMLYANRLVQYVETYGRQKLLDKYETMRQMYCERCTDNARKERMSSRYGLILLGAYLAKKLLKLDFDVDAICDFIINNENTSTDNVLNEYNDVYDKLISWVFANYNKFIQKGVAGIQRSEKVGRIEKVKGGLVELPDGRVAKMEVAIRVEYFRKFVKNVGYEDERMVLEWLKGKGLLNHEADRLTRHRKLVAVPELVYVVYIAEEKDEEIDAEPDEE